MSKYENYTEAAAVYADARHMAATAEDMGADKSAQAWLDEADEIRQDFFGPDKH